MRRAFTLVELLVTFAIIAVLAALISAGVMSWIGSQARRNTQAEIRSVYGALMQHWDAVANDAKTEKVSDTFINAVTSSTSPNPKLARIIWIKLRLMEAFPINFKEVKNNYTTLPLSLIDANKRRYMANYASKLPSTYTAAAPMKSESAACLLMALSVNRDGVSHNPDLYRPFTRDTDNDGVPELVDGWGEPLYFHRFPTGNSALQNIGSITGGGGTRLDPFDPNGLLLAGWSGGSLPPATFDAAIHKRLNGSAAWYAVPVIESSGPDMSLGNSLPAAPETLPDPLPEDNLASFLIK